MRALMLLPFVLLGACAPEVTGNQLGGVAKWYDVGPSSALKAADEHCARYHRQSRPVQTDMLMGAVTFSCEKS